ncbi:uncharacterized protein B0H18DRAFT_465905 [Fomitopsis serialis]|uniref:uncharacterized protein n=1 Tax=Fomitopsis serialis TaxID=139415 RepID=UPI002008B05F|nr:uncharacterized protein B0H18DRAFT_465905 [Neoantrodia serialis]KAH9923554.1 hypothetical protein B0H18DRAFT_465905 [Neoantrodia serialis]
MLYRCCASANRFLLCSSCLFYVRAVRLTSRVPSRHHSTLMRILHMYYSHREDGALSECYFEAAVFINHHSAITAGCQARHAGALTQGDVRINARLTQTGEYDTSYRFFDVCLLETVRPRRER